MISQGFIQGEEAKSAQLFLQKAEKKLKLMKQLMQRKLAAFGIQAAGDTIEGFD